MATAARATSALRRRMDVVHPVHALRIRLDRGYVEIDHHRLLAAAHEDARQRLVVAGVDLLVWNVWRHVDKIARARLGDELEAIAPAHASLAADDIDHGLDRPVVVR